MTTFDIVRDSFGRDVLNGWGQASNGAPWEVILGSTNDYDVDASDAAGTITHPTGDTHRVTVPGSFKNVSGTFGIRPSAVATGAAVVSDLLLRWVNDSNFIACRIEFNTAQKGVAVTYKVVGGVVTVLQTAIIATYLVNEHWHFKFEVTDNLVRTKLWDSVNTEPFLWDTSGSVSDVAAPGRIILQTRRELGNSNVGFTLTYHDFVLTSTIPTIEIVPQFLNDYEFKFGQGDDAIILNGGGGSIIPGEPLWDIQKVTGLDLPDVKVSDKEFDGIDGGVIDAANISMRSIRFEGILYAHESDSLEGYLDQLKANFAPVPRQVNGTFFDPSQKPLFIKAPGQPERFILAKSIGVKYDWDAGRRFNSTPFQVILQAQVPTLLSPELHVVTAALSGNVNTEHVLQAYNAGTYYSYAVIRFYQIGNTPEVYLRHVEQDAELSLFLGTDVSLANRPTEINMRQRTVFVIDTPPENHRMDVVAEGWWRLQPGMNTIVVRTDESNSGRVEILWRDEWL